ncbi:hypothetical protein J4558_24420 [Leptolyngbya sp. 15MV]|nr:hypothetical protein J4558_24420 [Leptolyngbya sp. 15MV]
MGRLIPPGTGMKYYRNVKVDRDPTENRKVEDEFDELANIRGGLDLPNFGQIPGVEDPDMASGMDDEEISEDSLDLEGTEEFDIDEAMKIELDDDEL